MSKFDDLYQQAVDRKVAQIVREHKQQYEKLIYCWPTYDNPLGAPTLEQRNTVDGLVATFEASVRPNVEGMLSKYIVDKLMELFPVE